MKTLKYLLALAVLATCSAASATTIVDQSYLPVSTNSFHNIFFGPVGQSFTPSLNSIDWAEFTFETFSSANASGVFYLELHASTSSGGIGPMLSGGTSELLPVSGLGGVEHFDFSSSVALSPNHLYWLMISEVPGSDFYGVGGTSPGGYPDGSATWDGFPVGDFSFQEGINVVTPEPSSLLLLGSGLLGLAGVVRRKLVGRQGHHKL